MKMTVNEVKRNVLGAKNQRGQIQICADLNQVDKQIIIEMLKEAGVDLRKLRGSTNHPAGTKKPGTANKKQKPEEPKKLVEKTASDPFAQIHFKMAELIKRKQEIDAELSKLKDQTFEIYSTIVKELGGNDDRTET